MKGPRVARQQRTGQKSGSVSTRRGMLNEERWDEILRAAAEAFSERGYRATRLQDIAERVGLLTGSLYYYIDSKEDLLFAWAQSSLQLGLGATAEDTGTAESDAVTRLCAFIQRQMQLVHRLRGPAWIEQDLASLSVEHRKQVDAMSHDLYRFVRQIIEQGMREGDFDPAVDAGVATTTLFELLRTTGQWAWPGRLSLPEIGDWYARMLVRGLARLDTLERLASLI
jgi:TetR/AcrR family transcriptional regulator, cholesterol catabolism regulator